ncbi:MAG: hypothetical protein J7K82_02030 [Thermoproteales archaeon]|nr:hypothetical protein [Thermoproteales archaeon]
MDKRGQTQVVETVLLIMITIALWTVIWTWFYPMYIGTIQDMGRHLLGYEMALKERVIIEYVNYTDSTLTVFITNTGDVEVEIGSLYVNDTLVWSDVEKIKVDEMKRLTVSGYTLGGEVLVVKACSLRGNCWQVVERVGP